MKLTPSQLGMELLLGHAPPMLRTADLKSRIRLGRMRLVRPPGPDFGYDALRRHEHLWATDAVGYKWARRSAGKWARHVRTAMARPEWVEAMRELEAEEGSSQTTAITS